MDQIEQKEKEDFEKEFQINNYITLNSIIKAVRLTHENMGFGSSEKRYRKSKANLDERKVVFINCIRCGEFMFYTSDFNPKVSEAY